VSHSPHHASSEEVAALEVSSEETREILERLSALEFGSVDIVTVGDVAEAAHATPMLVARILSEIRSVGIDELYERRMLAAEEKLREHEKLIERLTHEPNLPSSSRNKQKKDPKKLSEQEHLENQKRAWQELRPLVRSEGDHRLPPEKLDSEVEPKIEPTMRHLSEDQKKAWRRIQHLIKPRDGFMLPPEKVSTEDDTARQMNLILLAGLVTLVFLLIVQSAVCLGRRGRVYR
jgi:hypothetical protein